MISPVIDAGNGSDSPDTNTGTDTDTEADTAKGIIVPNTTSTTPATPLTVRIAFENAQTPPTYTVSATFENGTILRATCGTEESTADNGIACVPFGAQLESVSEDLHITVKARGHQFHSASVALSSLPIEGDALSYNVSLQSLALFETGEYYRTGFYPDELDAFKAMAYQTRDQTGAVQAVKFIVMNPHRNPIVYFMDTQSYPMHYYFARNVLKLGLDSVTFSQKVYAKGEREIMVGTIMFHETVEAESTRLGATIASPFELSFFPSDDLSVDQARLVHRLIAERLGISALSGEANRLYYIPAGENKERELAEQIARFNQWDASWLLRREIYLQKNWQVMNTGISYGTLRLADPEALDREAFSFRDIVVLPQLPVQLPIVGGTITEEFQTPLSHVNVMAKNRGTPNLTLAGAVTNSEVSDLFGRLVRFEVTNDGYRLTEADADEAAEYWASRVNDPIILRSDTDYSDLPLFKDIDFNDWICFGAKAANLAELHQLLGDAGPRGFAVPFYYYQNYMNTNVITADSCAAARVDCLSGGRTETVCEHAENLCNASVETTFATYVQALPRTDAFNNDTQVREATLAGLRFLIENGTVDFEFATALDARVAEVFGSDKVRLRSSTNTEDIPGFSGAGLYDSKSAYATGDDRASSRIRKVWASVWNWRAFEERSFWQIDHSSTFMGVAVNQSFGEEAVNGVLITQNIETPTLEGMYVNAQKGEISVTNPEGNHFPEIFTIIRSTEPGAVQAERSSFSSLSPNASLMTKEEVTDLFNAASTVQSHFSKRYDTPSHLLALDLEFKLLAGDRALVIKQVRPYNSGETSEP